VIQAAPVRWWWIRHAPVVNNDPASPPLIHGQMDVGADLSDSAALTRLAGELPKDALWLTSGLSRASQTAEALRGCQDEDIQAPVIVPAFNEQLFGDWQGLTHDRIANDHPDQARAFWADYANAQPPGGESFRDVMERVAPVVHLFCRDNPGADIIAIAHAGPIRAALALALDLTPEKALSLDIDNLSLSRIDWLENPSQEGGVWRPGRVNQRAFK